MAVNKLDPKIIFASEAPAQDVPAVFTNKTVGWGESRKNGGRPTIKQSNALQQETDLKILWLNENAVTPYDATIDYPVNAVTIKDGAFKIFNGSVWNNFLTKSSVDLGNVDNTSDLNKPISTATQGALNTKASVTSVTSLQTTVNTKADKTYLDTNLALKADLSVVKRGIGNIYDSTLTYNENERVILLNGDTVQSTISNNTNNPNTNMTGWKKTDDNTVESIADLIATQNPKDGQVVQVKGYYRPTNLALAKPYKGGGIRIYVESRKTENDGFLCVKGWVLQLESEIYTPYMSGCKCDGVTDDTLNLDKLMYALEVNNLSGKVFIEDDMFFNDQCPLIGKLTYGMNFNDGLPVIRLVDNVDIEIKSTLKFGSFYDDKNIAVFNAKYQESAEDWLGKKHYNINIFGGGVLDFTDAGIMRTEYRNRICFSLANCTNSSVHNLTVKGGDFMNTIVTNYRGYGVDIHHMTFIDQMSDVGKSYDHSTMYLIAENCNVYANEFISSSVKSRINACAVELHGNNQHMYGNKTFLGYRNAVFVAAYKLGHEGVDDTYRGNITIRDNTAQVTTFFKLWTDSVLQIGEINCENNIQNVAPFLSRADAIAGGADATQYDNLPLISHFFGTETDQNAYNFPDSPDAKIVIKNNQYYGGVSGYGKDLFMYTPLIMRDGLDIQYNTIKARQLFILEDDRGLLQPLIMRNFKFKNNNIVWSAIYDRIAITTQPVALQNCEIDVNVDFTFATTLTENDSMFWIDLKSDQSWNNKFKFTSDAYTKIKKWVGGNITAQNRVFYSYNSLVYDAKVNFSYFQEVNVKSVVLYTSDANICNGVKNVFAHSYLSESEITLVLPTSFQKDMRIGAVHNQVCAMSYYVISPQTGTLSMYCRVHS